MYYHIYCQLRAEVAAKRGGQNYYEKDIPADKIKTRFVIPFLTGEKFRLGGSEFVKDEINKFIIYSTLIPIQKLVDNINENSMFYLSADAILLGRMCDNTKYLQDETSTIIEECEQMIPNKEIEQKAVGQKLSRDIFIVHGHDNLAISEVKEFLRKLKFNPIVLREQANEGRTIIEKLIDRTQPNEIGYGIVLYTPCDKGYAAGHEADIKARARQNVVFEHGLLMGCLGRNRVHALVKGEIETPGDLGGIIYTTMDNKGAWGMGIVRELKALGYEVDANDLL